MSMKLLPRKEIDRAKALDKRREIDEGVKLAEKVDSLRELKAKEDEGLQKWRTETLKGIQAEIASLTEAKNALDREVTEKRGELLSLSAPLDKAWKFYVTSEREEISRLKSLASQQLGAVQRRVIESDAVAEDLAAQEGKLLRERQEIVFTRAETKRNLDESLRVVEEARQNAHRINKKAEATDKSIELRLLSVREREANVKLKEDSLKRKDDELETREMNALAKELLYYSPIKKN